MFVSQAFNRTTAVKPDGDTAMIHAQASMAPANAVLSPTVIESRRNSFYLNVQELWDFRELLYFLAWRDMKARYAQTVLGVAWAIIQPLAALVIFTIVFSLWAKLPSDGLPYPLFAYAALLPWTLLARSLERSGQSVVAESNLVKKVYFPRVILPIASTLAGVIDFVIAFALFLLLMAWYGIAPTWKVIAIPMLVLFTLGTSLAVSLWLSALNVHYRDVAGAIPLLTQLWMYASPVVYPLALVPEQWRTVYSLNPMAGIIEGFRWALLGGAAPDTRTAMLSASATGILLIFGLIFFNRMSRTFSDVV
jgi:lipopolysaccharide transport system permease protein